MTAATVWTGVLLRRPVRIVGGRAQSGDTNASGIICCDCGDHPDLDYSEVSTGLQRIRGPYPIADGVAAYGKHVKPHPQRGGATGRGRWPMLGDRR